MNNRITENYHTHTTRCQHAFGTEREYIEAAISLGMKTLGFSDHVPMPQRGDYVSNIRMGWNEADEYVECLRKLREEYKNQIKILIGFESEYVPDIFEEQCEMFDRVGVDYLILGEHFLEHEASGIYMGHPSASKGRLTAYVDACLEAMGTGRFMYLAHPDLINFIGDEDFYEQEMRRLCQGMKALNKPIECNVAGYRCNKHYPKRRFWGIAGEEKVPVVVGLDAHSIPDMLDMASYDACCRMLESCGVLLK